jgi:hypothetical protein
MHIPALSQMLAGMFKARIEALHAGTQAQQEQGSAKTVSVPVDTVEISPAAVSAYTAAARQAARPEAPAEAPAVTHGPKPAPAVPPPYETMGTRGIFAIEANLELETPRPAFQEDWKGSFAFSPGGGGVIRNIDEILLQERGHPLDYMLHQDYRKVYRMVEVIRDRELRYEESAASGSVYRTRTSARNLDAAIGRLADALQKIQARYEATGIQDYAQEVFLKRSQRFDALEIDLERLYASLV